MRARDVVPLLLLAGSLAPAAALAQERDADPCRTGRIATIVIDNKSIFDTSDPETDRHLLWAYRIANALHVKTRESVIRRELLFHPGDCYDPFLIAETERVLRGYDFLAEVDVRAELQADGTYRIFVVTRDDWSTQVDLRLRVDQGIALEGARINEGNLLGRGQSLGLFFFQRDVTRDYGVTYFTPQLAGTRWNLTAGLGRTRAGTFVQQEVGYPFVGEVSNWGGRQSFRRNDRFFDFIARDDPALRAPHVLVPLRDEFFDIAFIRRIGQPGNSALLGAGLSYQELDYPGVIQVAPGGDFDDRTPADTAQARPVVAQTRRLSNIRVALLLGHRAVWWVERRGFDTMRGLQDIPLGAEIGLSVSRSLPALENDDDLFLTLTLSSAMEIGRVLLYGRARGDVRRDLVAPSSVPEWQDLYGDGELMAYYRPSPNNPHTLFFRAAGIGGWNTRTPFQLTLGGERAVRGYDIERFPGGRRLVFSLEDRLFLGRPFRNVLDLGTTVFADAGRIWPGDAPFGTDSGWRASAGIGLRAAFPAGSRTTYRVDFAWPIEHGTSFGDFRIRLSVGEVLGIAATQTDLQLLRSRPEGVGAPLFRFR